MITTTTGWPAETAWAAPYIRALRVAMVVVLVLVFAYFGVEFTLYPRDLWLWNGLYYATLAALAVMGAICASFGAGLLARYLRKRRAN